MFPALLLLAATWEIDVRQLTEGPKHHFFGYIGHAGNTPWSGDGRYLVALETTFQDRMPRADDAANIVLIDTHRGHAVTVIDRTRAWNFQQGTMFYWNPQAADRELFFNDRDPATNRVFTVLYDIVRRKRIREYRFDDTPIGNSGVSQTGGYFFAINYGRLARLRPVTGYPEAYDWNAGAPAPDNDGVFRVDIATGAKRLLASFRKLAEAATPLRPQAPRTALFINHTLSSRDGTRVYFYLRGEFAKPREERIDIPFTMRSDGSALTPHDTHIGGHPEWEDGPRMIGAVDGRVVLYDVDRKQVAGTMGTAEVFPKTGGDLALARDGQWIVNGEREGVENFYVVFHRPDGSWGRSGRYRHPGFTSGDLRVDASPCWNRTGDQFAFPAIAPDGTRQMFVARVRRK